LDPDVFWADCVKFLSQDNKYVQEDSLIPMKDD